MKFRIQISAKRTPELSAGVFSLTFPLWAHYPLNYLNFSIFKFPKLY